MALVTCPDCGRAVSDAAVACPACGRPNRPAPSAVAPPPAPASPAPAAPAPGTAPRPTAGIVVGLVLCASGLLMNLSALGEVSQWPNEAVVQQFPALLVVRLASLAVGMLGNTTVLIGVGLALAEHRSGSRVVRVASALVLVTSLALSLAKLAAVTGAPGYAGKGDGFHYVFVGAVLGGMVGTVVQWGLLLFLFRRSRYP